jgi:hypothetical protein
MAMIMRRRLGKAAISVVLFLQLKTPDANARPAGCEAAAAKDDRTSKICNRLSARRWSSGRSLPVRRARTSEIFCCVEIHMNLIASGARYILQSDPARTPIVGWLDNGTTDDQPYSIRAIKE